MRRDERSPSSRLSRGSCRVKRDLPGGAGCARMALAGTGNGAFPNTCPNYRAREYLPSSATESCEMIERTVGLCSTNQSSVQPHAAIHGFECRREPWTKMNRGTSYPPLPASTGFFLCRTSIRRNVGGLSVSSFADNRTVLNHLPGGAPVGDGVHLLHPHYKLT
jgi:hypothetical protein